MPYQLGVCEVHRLVHGDTSQRNVKYCNCCHAWICDECTFSKDRLIAYAKARGYNPITFLATLVKCLGQ